MRFKTIKIDDPEYPQALMLRWEEMQKPLGLPPGTEATSFEENGMHILAMDGEQIVGCLFFRPEEESIGCIHHLAMSDTYRGQGYGRKFLNFLEKKLCNEGIREIHLQAMQHNIGFYLRMGFQPQGEQYEKRGVAFQEMKKAI